MRFELNTIGRLLVKEKSVELLSFLWGGIPLVLLFYFTVKYLMDNQVFLYLPLGIIYVAFFILYPINFKIKLNKVILSLEILDDKLRIETKKGIVDIQHYKIQKAWGSFSGFGSNHTDGYIISDKDGAKVYWLIATFFNELEELEKELLADNTHQ